MKALSINTKSKGSTSPGSTPKKQRPPLGEKNNLSDDDDAGKKPEEKKGGGMNRDAFSRMLRRGTGSSSSQQATPDDEPSTPASAPGEAGTPASAPTGLQGSLRRGSTAALGAALRAGALARKLSMRGKASRGDGEELPPFDASTLFEEGEAALARLEGQMTSVTIHGTDELPHDWRIAHPLMSVHVVNGYTGHPLRKSQVERAAVTTHERIGASEVPLQHILPVLTKPFALRGASARLPAWEEELVLNEAFTHLLHPRVYLLFELLDFAPDSPDSQGLTPFAWGFLKMISGPMSRPAHANALRPMPLRLQLYRWQTRIKPTPGQPAVWAQYLAAGRQKYGYSSTAYITVKPLPPPEPIAVRFPHRPMAAHHVEEGRVPFEKLQSDTLRDRALPTAPGGVTATLVSPSGGAEAQWLRATMQRGGAPCLLPNTLLHALPGGALGTTAVAISPDGTLVAMALAESGFSTIAVHEVQSGRRREAFHAHHRTVHELCWTADGERLVSVSADGTAKVWQPNRGEDESFEYDEPNATLPHPSYVYCVRAQPKPGTGTGKKGGGGGGAAGMAGGANAAASGGTGLTSGAGGPSLLVTGANDNALRLWDISGDGANLLATKNVHKARINAVAWPSEASIFSADGAGVVKHWEVEGRLGGGAGADLKLISSIEKKELRDVPINSVTLHPNRRRLLLQTRNHQLLALDTRLQHFSARYQGHRVGEYHVRATYSPDGRFVVAGSEDGRFFAWAEDSGNLILDGLAVGFSGPLLQISWCPLHDAIAMCGFGADNPALLYFHDAQKAAQHPLLAAAAAAAAATQSTMGAAAVGGAAVPGAGLSASADGLPTGIGGLADSTALSASAAERKAVRENRRAARRGGNLSASMDAALEGGGGGGGAGPPATPAGMYTSALGEEDPASRRKAAAAERRASLK